MIERKVVALMTCDFCGNEIDYDSYPKDTKGAEVVFSIAFEMKEELRDFSRAFPIVKPLGYGAGHMCGVCFKKIKGMTDWYNEHHPIKTPNEEKNEK